MKTIVKGLGFNYNEVETVNEPSIKTGIEIIDNFWSKKGGLVLGSTILLTGSSGAGKTTLAVFLQATMSHIVTSLYSREMPVAAVREQTDNLDITHGNDYISDEDTHTDIDEYLASCYAHKPKTIIIDSLQIVAKDYMEKYEMSESDAINLVIKNVRAWAKDTNGVAIIVGHVTKGDGFRGDNTIMQMVDAHLEMIYDKKANTRTISWGQKNRKGGDMGATIYYDFIADGLSFMSEDEYRAQKCESDVFDFILNALNSYTTSAINTKNSDYDKFKKELIKESKKIFKLDLSDLELVVEEVKLVDALTKKYNLVK